MNSTEYIKNAVATESRDFDGIRSRLTDRNLRLLHAAIGVATEGGELLDAIKKALFYGRNLDVVNFKEEIGDLFWYLGVALDELGTSFEEIMATNITKLKARYGDKFSEERAVNRDLKTERLILEGNAVAKCPRCGSTDPKVRDEVYSDSSLYDFRECPDNWHTR